MGFIIAKYMLYLILPPASLLVLIAGGLLITRWHRRAGRALAAAGICLLYLLSIDPVNDLLIRPLEAAYPPFQSAGAKAGAVVVLGGGVRDLAWVPSAPLPGEHSLSRLVAGIELARKLQLPLVITGGSGETTANGPLEADALGDAAVRLGFPRKDLVIESGSRNTWENAGNLSELIPGKTVVLVTSAFHMKRAAAMFRKHGFTVLPAPADYQSSVRSWSLEKLIPRARSLAVSSTALAERLSLAWYGMTGKL
jgi:uncharacterized SAM-binding protein YcdF (DUF218 family)